MVHDSPLWYTLKTLQGICDLKLSCPKCCYQHSTWTTSNYHMPCKKRNVTVCECTAYARHCCCQFCGSMAIHLPKSNSSSRVASVQTPENPVLEQSVHCHGHNSHKNEDRRLLQPQSMDISTSQGLQNASATDVIFFWVTNPGWKHGVQQHECLPNIGFCMNDGSRAHKASS